ncbi:hypothetical protein SFC65_20020 [Priestia filamentosa]|uniref:hypothetical protein n=1 Tax=Priestia filamentosa TaxID=1402861 RepID=UPI003981A2BA
MKAMKSDWTRIQEAQQAGLMVPTTNIGIRNKTELSVELWEYFKEQMPGYLGSFDQNECEDALYGINEYIKENNIDKHLLDFPLVSGSNVDLIPISDNLELKVTVIDEYYGDGDYHKCILVDSFLINKRTTRNDVDQLVAFINKYLTW